MGVYALIGAGKSYPTRSGEVHALRNMTFEIQRGERVALIGPSGAGKTSLFRLLHATLRPTRGTVLFDGRDLASLAGKDLRRVRRRIGTIFQQPNLVPALTALENAMTGRLGHWTFGQSIRAFVRPPADEAERAMAALRAVGLEDKKDARADELSGGQQQRLAIARVLVQDPDVILADEPFASLDPALTDTIGRLLLSLGAEGERTLVSTLHDVELALALFPRIIGLKAGELAFDLPAKEVDQATLESLYGAINGAAK